MRKVKARKAKVRAERKSVLLRGSVMSVSALCASTALTGGVLADPPANCAGSGGTYTCSGNQSKGFTFPSSVNGTLVKSVTVEDLTSDVSGRFFLNSKATASEGPINFSVDLGSQTQTIPSGGTLEQNFLLYAAPTGSSASAARINGAFTGTATNSASREVVAQVSEGTAGGNGTSPENKNGRPGGDGGNGGTNTLVLSQGGQSTLTSTVQNSTFPVILMRSSGGSGGDGGKGGKGKAVERSGGAGGDGGGTNSIFLSTSDLTTIEATTKATTLAAYGGGGGDGGNARNNGSAAGQGAGAGGAGGAGGLGGGIYFDISPSREASTGSWDITLSRTGSAIDVVSHGGDGGSAGSSFRGNGGNGGDGGDAGPISFGAAYRKIELQASESTAASILGQGGDGGEGSGVTDKTGRNSDGGSGGNGSDVILNGSWGISATSEKTVGIVALSQGGSGGRAGKARYYTTRDAGSGGSGGAVSSVITSDSAISTTGPAVDFRSIGGVGGTGTGIYSYGKGDGGPGGSGGDGGAIAFDRLVGGGDASTGSWYVKVSGSLASGVRLESAGGEGGLGGNGYESARGGAGGSGGDGGPITIGQGSRSIVVTGLQSNGLYALSIGGTGGQGGTSNGAGGGGGAGGSIVMDAGTSTLDSDWAVAVSGGNASGDYSTALLLLSKGGTGGQAGGRSAATGGDSSGAGGTGGPITLKGGVTRKIQLSGRGLRAAYIASEGGVGGSSNLGGGGAGGESAAVTISGTWDVTTRSGLTSGLSLSSRGGNGGRGDGNATRGGTGGKGAKGGNLVLLTGGASYIGVTSRAVEMSAPGGNGAYGTDAAGPNGIGGAGGAGADGGQIYFDVAPSGELSAGSWTVRTTGGPGIVASSTGGSGGGGGNGRGAAGGYSSPGGNGGSIRVGSGSRDVRTASASAPGVVLTSSGGKGGRGGSATEIFSDGKDGGDGGSGGIVSVSGTWAVKTSGNYSHGLVIESSGSSGGKGGTSGVGAPTGDGGSGGDGGSIEMVPASQASVITQGKQAIGIRAVSSGGNTGAGAGHPQGGAGGSIAISGLLYVSTLGTAAHGIYASSQGGGVADGGTAGAGGAVQLEIGTGSTGISSSGESAWAVLARSQGSTSGAVTISIGDDATVSGGTPSVSTATDAGGISVIGGSSNNRVTNAGTITSVDGAEGIAIAYEGGGKLVLTNESGGTTVGKLVKVTSSSTSAPGSAAAAASPQPIGTIEVINKSGGRVISGSRMDADFFVNRGVLSPGGRGAVETTKISGDLTQSSSGKLVLDLDTTRGETDRLRVGGAASLGGEIEVTLTDFTVPLVGARRSTLVSAEDGLSLQEGLSLTQSAVGQFRLAEGSSMDLQLAYDIDFANDSITAALNNNQDRVAGHIQALYEEASLEPALAEALFAIEETEAYAAVVNNLSAEVALDNQLTAVTSGRLFRDGLFSCAQSGSAGDGAVRFYDEGQCAYLRFDGLKYDRDRTSDNLGYGGTGFVVTLGGQAVLEDNWILGGAVAYERRSINASDSDASSTGNQVWLGLSGSRRFGAVNLQAAFGFGHGGYEIERSPFPGLAATGDQSLWSTSGEFRAEYILGTEDFFVKPRFGVAYDYFFSSSFEEDGNSGTRLAVSMDDAVYVSLNPAVEVGGAIREIAGLEVRPHLSLGLTQYVNAPEARLTARFVSAPNSVPGFEAATPLDKSYLDIAGGLDILALETGVLRAGGFASLARNDGIYGGSLKLEVPF